MKGGFGAKRQVVKLVTKVSPDGQDTKEVPGSKGRWSQDLRTWAFGTSGKFRIHSSLPEAPGAEEAFNPISTGTVILNACKSKGAATPPQC